MPKLPEQEWMKTLDPRSSEYSPTARDVEKDHQMAESFNAVLSDIEYSLVHPSRNPYTGAKDKFTAINPEAVWDSLAYAEIDFLSKIKDAELRKDLQKKLLEVEQKVYKLFVPFIEARVNAFGWYNSPLEQNTDSSRINTEVIVNYFDQARSILKHFKVSANEQIDFLSELDSLQERFDRYRTEPTLFTFESIEEELQQIISDSEYNDYYIRPRKSVKTFGEEATQKKTQDKFETLLGKAYTLSEIASRMINEAIRKDCKARSQTLFEYVEYLKAKNDAPQELITIEAELKDFLQRINSGEKIAEEELDSFGFRLTAIKGKKLGFDHKTVVESLEKLFVKVKQAFTGERINEDDDFLFRDEVENVDWAWSLLGVERGDSKEDIKNAYRKLARKYHPDVSDKKDAAEKMKKINQALELIKRAGEYK